ncbi:putative secreted protein (Por secretion system target) [Neolewinella xylanilytica]|uniref:Putative secreted protein (Por secretion system target) n=2 Tax=Neolewinella xylanilytica TaxID=1514080 RepID=A0A2S6I6F6_9BACT|nr:putative secreted protein (Por secretion system target) [Neolewinella xylanilytica]
MLVATLPLVAQYRGGPDDGHGRSRSVQINLKGKPAGIRPLYGGGAADGHANRIQNASLLDGTSLLVFYGGGRGDGHDGRTIYATSLGGPSLAMLYAGGPGDGHDRGEQGAVAVDGRSLQILYAGGAGDGHDRIVLTGTTIAGEPLLLYAGGAGDGHDQDLLTQTALGGTAVLNALYTGGTGSGFDHAVYFGAVAVPLKLISFTATDYGTYALLEWETEAEVETDYFTVQKIAEGTGPEEVGNVAAAGFTAPGERRGYRMQDPEVATGTSHYRLQFHDLQGRTTVSDFIPLTRSAATPDWDFTLYPNPNEGTHFNLRPTVGTDRLALTIYDAGGRQLLETTVAAGTPDLRITLQHRLSPGSYLIRATDAAGRTRTKFLVVGR